MPNGSKRRRRVPVEVVDQLAEANDTPVTEACYKTVRVTPAMAFQLLERNVENNRPVRQPHVNKMARDMKEGRWKQNGETVKFAKDGTLLDGQHRLWAVTEAGRAVDLNFVEGLDKSVVPTIDTGRSRSFADVMKFEGREYGRVVGGVSRWLWWYGAARDQAFNSITVSHQELHAVVDVMPEIEERVHEVMKARQFSKLMAPTILGFVYTCAYRTDHYAAQRFLELLDSGVGLTEKSPVKVLRDNMVRNKISSRKMQPSEVAATAVKAWNAFRKGKPVQLLRFGAAETFPAFDGMPPLPEF